MKKLLFVFVVVISLIGVVLGYIPSVIELQFKYYYLDLPAIGSPIIFSASLFLYMGLNKRWGMAMLFFILHFLLSYAKREYDRSYQKSLEKSTTFYLNTGTRDKAFYDNHHMNPKFTCRSMQSGREREFSGTQEKDDTIIVKMSLDDFIICVYKDDPSPAEIQKYMEPVLFIDGVEQPRPEYDDLKLSDEERRDLLREHHIEVARVVKKERDKFLRNLVTLQVNDTIQKTVNLMYKDEEDYDDIFDSLNEESYVLVKVSDINPKVIEVADWQPTTKEIDKYNVKSYLMLATVISKKSEETKQAKHSMIYYAKLRINDKMETSFIRVRGMFQSDYQVYESQ
ncbi:MAG: hypothetical protein K6G73_08365 [Marinilabiliaceae bacterium]|nr:hypothetical protein [Marinilabiliaceae bacterium]